MPEKETPALALIKKRRPNDRFRSEYRTMKHEYFGDIKLELHLAEDNLIRRVMHRILKSKSMSVSLFNGALVAELSPQSKLRIKALRRLRGKRAA